jgi:hypothetical protein
MQVAPDVADKLRAVRQERKVPGIFDGGESAPRDFPGQRFLARRGNDHVAISGQNQRRGIDLREPIRNIERFQLSQASGHDALIGFPNAVDYEVHERTWFRFSPIQQMEKLIDERVVAGQREPLEGQPRDLGTDRSMEPSFNAIHDERAQTVRVLRGVFERDRPAERNADDSRQLKPELIDQNGEVVCVVSNIAWPARLALEIAPTRAISAQTG